MGCGGLVIGLRCNRSGTESSQKLSECYHASNQILHFVSCSCLLVQPLRTTEGIYKIKITYIVAIALWHQHIHLRGLGADDLDVERLRREVDLAAVGLVDGYGGHLAQNLQQRNTHKSYAYCTIFYTAINNSSVQSLARNSDCARHSCILQSDILKYIL